MSYVGKLTLLKDAADYSCGRILVGSCFLSLTTKFRLNHFGWYKRQTFFFAVFRPVKPKLPNVSGPPF